VGLPRPCLVCGTVTTGSYCDLHQREPDQRRNTTGAQGAMREGSHRLRRQWLALVASGEVSCARCGQTIEQWRRWDLDHLPDGTEHPSHQRSNRSAGAGW